MDGRPTGICRPIPAKQSIGDALGFGARKGMLVVNVEGEDHLADFVDYMP